jgi:cyanophycinase-like exopeptidase
MLEADTVVLGVDEHTAAVFDLDADTVTVLGRATLTVRRQGVSTVFATGSTVAIDELRAIAAGGEPRLGSASAQPSAAGTTRHHRCARKLNGWSTSSLPGYGVAT